MPRIVACAYGWSGLESGPRCALRVGHAADVHARVNSEVLRNGHRWHGSALRTAHRVCEATGARVAELLNRPPLARAGVACFALDAIRVIAGVLVERNSVHEVGAADDVAAAAAVVPAKVPGEGRLTDGASRSRLIRLLIVMLATIPYRKSK